MVHRACFQDETAACSYLRSSISRRAEPRSSEILQKKNWLKSLRTRSSLSRDSWAKASRTYEKIFLCFLSRSHPIATTSFDSKFSAATIHLRNFLHSSCVN